MEPGDAASDLALLATLTRELATSLDVELTLRQALNQIMAHLEAEAASIFLVDDSGTSLVCHRCAGPSDITGLSLPLGEGIVGRVVATGQPLLVHDAQTHHAFAGAVDALTGFHTRSLLCVPLSVGERCLGALELLNKRNPAGKFVERDLLLAGAMAAAAALAIHNGRMVRDLIEQERDRKALELAREIQLGLLPPAATALPLCGLNLPARRVSGDFFDYALHPDGRLYFSIADVAGKGMDAALLMAKTSSLLRCLAREISDPAELLERVNAEVHETASFGMFVTIIAGFVASDGQDIVYANAGHHPLLLRLGDGRYEYLPVHAPPLGVLPRLGVEVQRVPWGRGALYLYTDGITEARNPSGQPLGLAGLLEHLDAVHALPFTERPAALVAALRAERRRFHDDLTLLVLEPAARGELLLHLVMPAQATKLAAVRRQLRAALDRTGCPQACRNAVVMAVNEACMNIIQHAYAESGEGHFEMELWRDGATLEILLLDFAPPVDPSRIAPRELHALRPGGLGTHFIQSAVDEWQYATLAGERGNTLRLRKRMGDP